MPNEEKGKPIYKKWWFWAIVAAVVILIGIGSSENENTMKEVSSNNTVTSEPKIKNVKSEVTVVDFSTMSKEDIKSWFNLNKINGNIYDEYSDTIAKGNFISQSIEANQIIHEGDKIKVTFSLGKEPTTEQKNALKKAETYAKTLHMSKQGIYDQLTSEYGEKFDKESAQYAIDNLTIDWNLNALEKAKTYQKSMNMSKKAIYDQLISDYGEKFTTSEAQYAIDHLEE